MSVKVVELGTASKARSVDDRWVVLGPLESSAVEMRRSASRRDRLRGREEAVPVSVAAVCLRVAARDGLATSRPAAARSAARRPRLDLLVATTGAGASATAAPETSGPGTAAAAAAKAARVSARLPPAGGAAATTTAYSAPCGDASGPILHDGPDARAAVESRRLSTKFPRTPVVEAAAAPSAAAAALPTSPRRLKSLALRALAALALASLPLSTAAAPPATRTVWCFAALPSALREMPLDDGDWRGSSGGRREDEAARVTRLVSPRGVPPPGGRGIRAALSGAARSVLPDDAVAGFFFAGDCDGRSDRCALAMERTAATGGES